MAVAKRFVSCRVGEDIFHGLCGCYHAPALLYNTIRREPFVAVTSFHFSLFWFDVLIRCELQQAKP